MRQTRAAKRARKQRKRDFICDTSDSEASDNSELVSNSSTAVFSNYSLGVRRTTRSTRRAARQLPKPIDRSRRRTISSKEEESIGLVSASEEAKEGESVIRSQDSNNSQQDQFMREDGLLTGKDAFEQMTSKIIKAQKKQYHLQTESEGEGGDGLGGCLIEGKKQLTAEQD